jgi:hypothetical protein
MLQCNKYRYSKERRISMPVMLALATAEIIAAGVLVACCGARSIYVIHKNLKNKN